MTTADTNALQAPTAEQFQEWIGRFMANGHTIKEASHLTDKNIAALYSAAHGDYEGGRYERAQALFRLLCMLDHMKKKHWKGLGAASQMAKDYDAAVYAYTVEGLFDFDDPTPRLHAADCYMALGDREAAADGFRYVVRVAGDRPECKEVKERAEARLEMLSSQADGGVA